MAYLIVLPWVVLLEPRPQLVLLSEKLLRAVDEAQHARNRRDDLLIVQNDLLLLRVLYRGNVHLLEKLSVYPQLLVDALYHRGLLNALIVAADEVVVEVHVEIVHRLDVL